MDGKYRAFGHPIDQTVVPLAVGSLSGAAVFDAVARVAAVPSMAELACWLIGGRVVTAT